MRARGQRWRVTDFVVYKSCCLLTLAGAAGAQRVLTPFDDVEPIRRNERPQKMSARRWRHACRSVLAADTPPGRLRTAAHACIDLLPHQLEPALAVLRGDACRLLLADAVGLGKTVQATLVIAELLARGTIGRVLILTPAGLRDQWAGELAQRFGIHAAVADAATLRRLVATLPLGINPWTTIPIAVASIDYVKRLEVLPAVCGLPWDVVVVDEAHASTGDSERRDAVRLLAERAAYVLLLTATPHNGDDAAFDQLCDVGRLAIERTRGTNRLLVFRRTPHAIRDPQSRRIQILRVRSRAAERGMHDALVNYRRAVAAEHGDRALALSVLEKRALSSPWSLAQSVDRRLARLADDESATDQLLLPLGDPDGELTGDDAPPAWPADLALADSHQDRRLLTALAAAARDAAWRDDSKLRCLKRLSRRIPESILVFTEYRDTALHLRSALGTRARLLHGGMDRRERSAVLDEFVRDRGLILVATDAAGQGLNLHHACRLVVNVELPWNPMRLEQRIGRVDRIGQQRRVHAVHLVARNTSEETILERLRGRVARARAAIDAPNPLDDSDVNGPLDRIAADAVLGDEHAAADEEALRLHLAREMGRSPHEDVPAVTQPDRPWLLPTRRPALRAALAGRTLLLYRLSSDDADGRTVESRIVALLVDKRQSHDAVAIPPPIVAGWEHDVACVLRPFHETRIAREEAIAETLAASPLPLFQPALFDRRADAAHEHQQRRRSDAARAFAERLAAIRRMLPVGPPGVHLLFLVRP